MRIHHGVLTLLALAAAACAGISTAGPVRPATASAPASAGMSGMSHAMPGAGAPAPTAYSREVREAYDLVRAATAPFKVLDSAVARGYAKDVAMCFADSIYGSGGAMGYHHVNRGYIDAKLEVDKPEIIMYERTADGRYELTGVEYLLLFRYWPKDSVPPKFLGRELLRDLDRNYWYTHMWIWKPSATGLFADWNPSVKCPAKGSS
jgi:hypothetical protein